MLYSESTSFVERKTYKTVIRPVFFYVSEVWVMTQNDAQETMHFGIYGGAQENNKNYGV